MLHCVCVCQCLGLTADVQISLSGRCLLTSCRHPPEEGGRAGTRGGGAEAPDLRFYFDESHSFVSRKTCVIYGNKSSEKPALKSEDLLVHRLLDYFINFSTNVLIKHPMFSLRRLK